MNGTGRTSPLITLASVALVVASLYLARDVLIPVALATLLAFLLAPPVARLERFGLRRTGSVLAVVGLSFVVVGLLGWLVAGQFTSVAEQLPQYADNLRERLATVREAVGGKLQEASETVEEIGKEITAEAAEEARADGEPEPLQVAVAEPRMGPIEALGTTVGPLFSVLGFAGIVVIFVVFMLLAREDLRDRFIRLAGAGEIPLTTQALDEASRKVSRYLLLQTMINGAHGAAVAIGLGLIGHPNFLLWGLLSMLLRYIPYVGPWIAAAFPVFTALMSHEGWSMPLATISLFVVLELVSNNWVEPRVYGSRTGVSEVALLISAVFWTWLWGSVGLLLSTPLTVCLAVMGKYVPRLEFLWVLLGDEPVLPPEKRLYQRLLAADPEEAWKLIDGALSQRSLLEVYDTIVLPALALAEHDARRGVLDRRAQDLVLDNLLEIVDGAGEVARRSPLEARAQAQAGPAPRVLCLPARDEADQISSRMLAQVLEQAGVDAEAASVHALASELVELVADRRADLVCVSSVPPTGLAHARYLCKRLCGRFAELPLVVGVWGADLDREGTLARIGCGANTAVAGTLAEARALALEALAPLREANGRALAEARRAAPGVPGVGGG